MNRITTGIIVLSTFVTNLIYAGNPHIVKQLIDKKDWNFVENKGQLGKSEIKYYGHQGGVYLFCKPGTISFVFTKTEMQSGQVSEATGKQIVGYETSEYSKPKNISTYTADLILVGSNPDAQIISSEQQDYFENYYTSGVADNGITNVHTFKTITYESIYPNIDMVLHSKSSGMKYEFIVHSGGYVSDIQMRWKGLQDLKMIEDGGIEYGLAFGKMEEGKPLSFQGFNLVESSFLRNGDKIGFDVDAYNKNENLVIDPMIEWGTYYGKEVNIYGYAGSSAAASDSLGNIYITGNTWSYTNIATSGSFQSYFAGGPPYPVGAGTDAYLAKFSSNGSLLWATYYGGDQADNGVGVATDGPGNIFLLGLTNSSSGIATSGAYISATPFGGQADANFIVKFNGNGQRKWGTYYYGNKGEVVGRGIATDYAGNVFITGYTTFATNLATSGGYQTVNNGGYDAFLVKFSSTGSLMWSTYFGGAGNEIANSVATDFLGNVIIGGNFVAKFNKNGNIQWSSNFGATVTSLLADAFGNIIVCGITSSNTGIATNGAYKTVFGGVMDAYLAQFTPTGTLNWATYYGGSKTETVGGMVIDMNGSIYLAGSTNSDSDIATVSGLQKQLIGSTDGYIAKFTNKGNLQWGSYFAGSSEVASPTALAINNLSGDVYLYGALTTDSFIATKGAYQSYGTRGDYAFLIKFDLHDNDAGVAAIQVPNGTFCSGSQVVKINLYNYGITNLISAKIGWSVNDKVQTPYNWSGKLKSDTSISISIGNYKFLPGTYRIKVWTYLPNGVTDSVPSNDTAYTFDTVQAVPATKASGNHAICYGNSITLGENDSTGHTYLWTSFPPNFISHLSKPTFDPTNTTTFYLKETLDSTGCSSIDSAQIIVNPVPTPYVIPGQYICDGKSISLGTTSVNGNSYSWSSKPLGYTSTLSNPSFTPVGTTIFYLLQTIGSTGCSAMDSTQIIVAPSPTANVGNPKSICDGTSIMLGSAAVIGDSYEWSSNPSGFTSLRPEPFVNPSINTLYYLTETNTYGCSASDSTLVTVYSLPIAAWTASLDKCEITLLPIVSTYKKYLWNFGDGDTSVQFGPAHTYSAKGKFQLRLNITNSHGCSSEHDTIITIDKPCSSWINEAANHITNLSLYPNPFSSHFTIQYDISKSSKVSILIFDIAGKRVGSVQDNFQNAGHYAVNIDCEAYNLHSGMYLLKFITEDGTVSKELVKY